MNINPRSRTRLAAGPKITLTNRNGIKNQTRVIEEKSAGNHNGTLSQSNIPDYVINNSSFNQAVKNTPNENGTSQGNKNRQVSSISNDGGNSNVLVEGTEKVPLSSPRHNDDAIKTCQKQRSRFIG